MAIDLGHAWPASRSPRRSGEGSATCWRRPSTTAPARTARDAVATRRPRRPRPWIGSSRPSSAAATPATPRPSPPTTWPATSSWSRSRCRRGDGPGGASRRVVAHVRVGRRRSWRPRSRAGRAPTSTPDHSSARTVVDLSAEPTGAGSSRRRAVRHPHPPARNVAQPPLVRRAPWRHARGRCATHIRLASECRLSHRSYGEPTAAADARPPGPRTGRRGCDQAGSAMFRGRARGGGASAPPCAP